MLGPFRWPTKNSHPIALVSGQSHLFFLFYHSLRHRLVFAGLVFGRTRRTPWARRTPWTPWAGRKRRRTDDA